MKLFPVNLNIRRGTWRGRHRAPNVRRPVGAALTVLMLLTLAVEVSSILPVAPAQAAQPDGDLVESTPNFGYTEGSFSVGHDGSAQYTIPLWVPKGRGIVAPQLALSYSSGGGNGLLGVGWSLTGLSTISPCARTIAQDGASGGVNFDDKDVFCLGGNRLRPVTAGGSPEREYRTEQESFAKIVAYGMGDGVPDSFKVWSKDGTISSYGATANSKMQAFRLKPGPEPNTLVRESTTTRVTLAWAVNKIEDRNGNAATIEYERYEGGAAQLWHVESRPLLIKFAPNREVRFGYEDRLDVLEGFGRGVHTREPRRMNRIEMWGAALDEEAELLRSYQIGYSDTASISKRSLVMSVAECDHDGTCKRSQKFQWSTGSFDFEVIDTDITDAGRHRPVGLPDSDGGDSRILVLDVNGDGRDDLLYPDSRTIVQVGQQQAWWVRLSNGSGFGPALAAGFLPPRHGCSDPNDRDSCMPSEGQVRPIDADMDGRADVAVWVQTTGGQHKWRLFTFNGTRFVPYAQELETAGESGDDPNPVYFADIDGNGTPDYLTAPFAPASGDSGPINGPWTYRLNTAAPGAARFAEPVSTGRTSPPFTTNNRVVDVNADGRADLVGSVATAGGGLTVGLGLSATGAVEARQYASAPYGAVAADVNGDGLDDGVDAFTVERAENLPLGSVRASLNSGNGYAPMSETPTNFWEPRVCCGIAPPPNGEPSFIDHTFDRGVRYVDFNGDGNSDVLVFRGLAPANGSDVKNGVQLFVWRDGKFERVPLGQTGVAAGDWGPNGFAPSQVLDIDGDGMLDIVHVEGFCKPDCHVRVLKRRGGPPDRLTGIGDRNVRERIEIDYTHLGDDDVHTPGTCTYPQTCVKTGGTIVSQHRVANLVGSGEAAFDRYNHTYAGGRVDLHGRGWLGFASHTVTRVATGATTVTEFDNVTRDDVTKAYALAFYPKKVTTTVVTGAPNGREHQHTTVVPEPIVRRYPGGTYGVEAREVFDTHRERIVDGTWTVLRQTVTVTDFDGFGNRDLTVTTTTGGRKLTEDPTFINDLTNWLIGLPDTVLTTGCTVANKCDTREVTFAYDAAGNQTESVVQPDLELQRLKTTTDYGQFGIVEAVIREDSTGIPRKDRYEYDADLLYPDETFNALEHKTSIEIDSGLGVPLKTTDPNGVVTTKHYDRFGRLRGTFGADGSYERIQHSVESATQTTTTTVAGGGRSEVVTDRLGREIERRVLSFNGVMAHTYTHYDALGRVQKVSHPTRPGDTIHYTTRTYDSLDRISTVTAPDGALVRTSYLNREVHTVDAKGVESFTTSTVDGDIQSSFEDDPNSGTLLRTVFLYGPFGETEKIVAPDNSAQIMEYDELGRREKLTDPSAGVTSTVYNGFGEITKETDSNGSVTTNTIDKLGRITSSVSPDGTMTNVWDTAANGLGKLAKATSADGTVTTHTYSPLNQLKGTKWTIDGTAYEINYDYDPNIGRQTGMTYPAIPGVSGRLAIAYAYNTSGYLKSIRDTASGGPVYWTADTRNAMGQLTKEHFHNGVIAESTYTPETGLLDIATVTGPGSTGELARLDYGYDLNRNVNVRNDTHNHRWEKYGHDELNRIKSWSTMNNGPNQPWINATYSYDEVGNLKTETFKAQGVDITNTYTYDPRSPKPHLLRARNNAAYTYDAAGRQLTGAGRTITYNEAGLPKRLTWGQGQETVFKYDAAGSQVLKRDAESTVVYVPGLYERRNPAGTGSTEIHNLHNIVVEGRVVAQVNRVQASPSGPATTKVYYVHADGQGSTMLVTNASGTRAGGQEGFLADLYYDPFGRRIDANYAPLGNQRHGGPREGYTGHEHYDEFGLINMKGRIYDPETRRFLTPDPFVENAAASQSLNRYAYVRNNPTTHTDPTGYRRSASYWDEFPASYDPEARAKVLDRIQKTLDAGGIVILNFGGGPDDLNGSTATTARSDDDSGRKNPAEASLADKSDRVGTATDMLAGASDMLANAKRLGAKLGGRLGGLFTAADAIYDMFSYGSSNVSEAKNGIGWWFLDLAWEVGNGAQAVMGAATAGQMAVAAAKGQPITWGRAAVLAAKMLPRIAAMAALSAKAVAAATGGYAGLQLRYRFNEVTGSDTLFGSLENVVTGLFNAADYRGDHSSCPVCLRREAERMKELQNRANQPIPQANQPLLPDPGPNAVWPPANTTPANTQEFPWRQN